MYFLYTISLNKLVFYVGITKRPLQRFRDHYYDPMSAVYKVHRYCLSVGKVCNMAIIDTAENKVIALKKEQEKINELSDRYYLLNNTNYLSPFYLQIPYTKHLHNTHLLRPVIRDLKQQYYSICPTQILK